MRMPGKVDLQLIAGSKPWWRPCIKIHEVLSLSEMRDIGKLLRETQSFTLGSRNRIISCNTMT
jgi:hypothetical protein